MFKNILRTFDAKILKIFKNIQPQPKIERSYKKDVVDIKAEERKIPLGNIYAQMIHTSPSIVFDCLLKDLL